MPTLQVKIPDHLDPKKQGLLLHMAINLYEQEILTLQEAATMAEITVDDFQGRYSIYLHDKFEEHEAEYITNAPFKRLPIKEELENKKDQIEKLCKENNVKTLYIFGSALRDDFNIDKSDLDFVVEFDKSLSMKSYTDCFFELLFAFENLFHRKIDLVTNRSIKNPILKEEIEKSKKIIYAA